MLKSAQFPVHGWLTEVIETPTPVSALLHAGVINGGGFLLIHFADVILLAPGVLAALVMVGGFTALFGGLAMLTQSAVKNSLAWSTIAQMGFMIMQCGLALFPLALLHIAAHSLYKAHAFLDRKDQGDDLAARNKARAKRAWGRFKFAAVSSFAFVEAMGPAYAARLVRDALGLSPMPVPNDPAPHFDPELDLDTSITTAETVLRTMSLS